MRHAQAEAAVADIEALIHQEVGRNLLELFAVSRGALWPAAQALAGMPARRVGVITGFYVPWSEHPSAETDGPVGAALLLRGLVRCGLAGRLATDSPCAQACRVALDAAGAADVQIDVALPGESMDNLIGRWREAGLTHAVSIERCGKGIDGVPRNMRGVDISAHTAPLDDLFSAGPWATIAVGDGGNEIGMGSIDRDLIGRHVVNGERIACATAADHLLVAGVSNWGAFALLGAVAVLRPEWRATLLDCLDVGLHDEVLDTMVREGPAVDGVNGKWTVSVDNVPLALHHEKIRAIRGVVEEHAAG